MSPAHPPVRPTTRRPATALLAAALAGLLASCSATTVTGNALRDPRVDKNTVIPALLNPGNYPTTPAAPMGNAGDQGGLAEARRMADYIVLPFEVDPALTKSGGVNTGVLKNPVALSKVADFPTTSATPDRRYVAGFTAVADTPRDNKKPGDDPQPPEKSLRNTVVRYASDADAAGALADMAAASAVYTSPIGNVSIPTTAITLPGKPQTRAFTLNRTEGRTSMITFTAHGPYLLSTYSFAPTQAAAAALASAALDKQLPLIDQFQPTPVDKLADLPLDPDGLWARSLPAEKADRTVNDGAYGAHGMLAFSSTAAADQKLFADNGVDRGARGGAGTVTRAKDAAGAARVAAAYIEETRNMEGLGFVDAPPVPGLPGVKCLTQGKSSLGLTYCAGNADRYVIEMTGANPLAAQQQISAQYLMVTAP